MHEILNNNLDNNSINLTICPDEEMIKTIKQKFKQKKEHERRYFLQAKNDALMFHESIKRCKPDLLSGKNVLDYGCGHGRLARYYTKLFSPSKLVVADVWESAVNFCSKEFNAIPWIVSKDNPISNLGIKFDLILSYSVFSHLPPKSFENNLLELVKSLSKNGLLLFTAKGEYHAKKQGISLKDGYFFGQVGKVPNHTAGRLSGDEYSFMCVSQSFITKIFDRVGLRLVECITAQQLGSRQDLYVVMSENKD